MTAGPVATAPRHAGWIPEAVLGLGVLATTVEVGALAWSREWGDPGWMLMLLLGIGLAALVRRHRPTLPASTWFALMAGLGPVTELLSTLAQISAREGNDLALAWVSLLAGVGSAASSVVAVLLIGLFPEGRARTRTERVLVVVAVALLPVPVLVGFGAEHVWNEWYLDLGPVDNPLAVLPFTVSDEVAGALSLLTTVLWVVAFATLGVRYRRSGREVRRSIRWLLLPVVLLPIGVATEFLLGGDGAGGVVIWLLWMTVTFVIVVAVTMGLLAPDGLDVDTLLRRTVVYGALWLAITGTYVGVATLVGTAAGRYLPVPWAVAVALAAALLFQPARRRLERVADRWVFGRRTDPAEAIAALGSTLAQTFELETLLPRMTAALESGLGLAWAEVRLDDRDAPDAEVEVPVVLDGEQLGVLACGPKRAGTWTDEDRTVVATFARQAALAVRNVRLTEHLASHADEIAASRTRLVKAQESERRRIERNIHDGVQQDLVALIGLAGRLRSADPAEQDRHEEDLELLSAGLARVLDDLRDLARGIHPSLLSDKGLLPAVEALAARHPVPVDLRADPDLRHQRFAADVEAACYFTVAEALANTLKHARAGRVCVELSRRGDDLCVTVTDDGVGFRPSDPPQLTGQGLTGMKDRFAALDGSIDIDSRPGLGTTVSATISVGASSAP
jgi:signal transduction histidine kinase